MPTSSSSNPEPVTVLRGHAAEVTTARFMDGCDDDGLPHLLSGGSDGEFDPATAEFAGGKVYDFPRTTGGCEVQYCNVEGIHWVSGGKDTEKSPQMLVAVSDKMKSRGRQSASCFDKDQSVHLFSMP